MDLIEQLGGYERAKHEFEMIKEMKPTYPGEIEANNRLLLEYRRQHNIFEIGDKVVFIESELKNPRLMTVIEVSEPICGFLMAECSLGITNGFYSSRYRHATDEEIKAGKRLEVNQ
ncbi:MAG: hypothetical protein GX151_03010 [Gammaproteobacteria bacterium]|nr:hypothetical protein [Gammaproteobacteria bacterium]